MGYVEWFSAVFREVFLLPYNTWWRKSEISKGPPNPQHQAHPDWCVGVVSTSLPVSLLLPVWSSSLVLPYSAFSLWGSPLLPFWAFQTCLSAWLGPSPGPMVTSTSLWSCGLLGEGPLTSPSLHSSQHPHGWLQEPRLAGMVENTCIWAQTDQDSDFDPGIYSCGTPGTFNSIPALAFCLPNQTAMAKKGQLYFLTLSGSKYLLTV